MLAAVFLSTSACSLLLGTGDLSGEGGSGATPDASSNTSADANIASDGGSEVRADAGDGGAYCRDTDPFSPPEPVPALNSTASELGVTLRADQLEIVFSTKRNGTYDMFGATRASVDVPFPAPALLFGAADAEQHPTLSADGLTLIFVRNFKLVMQTRGSNSAAFGNETVLSSLAATPTANDGDPALSADGEELFFVSERQGSWDLYHSLRGLSGFQTPTRLDELATASLEGAPVISADRLTLYYVSRALTGGDDVLVARRPSVTSAFGTPNIVNELSSVTDERPMWLSPDDCTMYLVRVTATGGLDIFIAHRTPR